MGNHEFDEGIQEPLRLQRGGCHPATGCFGGTRVQYLTANVVWADTEKPVLPPCAIRWVQGVPVGFIGVVTADTPSIVTATVADAPGIAPDPGIQAMVRGYAERVAPRINQVVTTAAGPSLFDQQDLAEITSPDYPGERLIVCHEPYLAEERRRKRGELLDTMEKDLARLARRVAAGRLKRAVKIAEAVGRIEQKHQMGKHFRWEVGEGRFACRGDPASIDEEAALDGFYVIRTSVPSDELLAPEVVLAYKSLRHVERLIRTIRTVLLKVRPIRHWTEDWVRAHIFLCVLAKLCRVAPARGLSSLFVRPRGTGGSSRRLPGAPRRALGSGASQGPDQAASSV